MDLTQLRHSLVAIEQGQEHNHMKEIVDSDYRDILHLLESTEGEISEEWNKLYLLLREWDRIDSNDNVLLIELADSDEPRQLSGKELEKLFIKISLAAQHKKAMGSVDIDAVSDERLKGKLQKDIESKIKSMDREKMWRKKNG